MTIDPYDTREPYLWAGDYLAYRGKIVGLVKLSEKDWEHQPWLAVPLMTNRGELRSSSDTSVQHGHRSISKAGAMLCLQDWLASLMKRDNSALETFVRSDPTVQK